MYGRKLLLFFLLFITLPGLLLAQVSRGTITGRVTDAQGAIVPGAHVVATQVATGVKSEVASNGEGGYTIPFLVPGTYRVSCVLQGFKKFESRGVVVGSNERVTADVVLEVGAESETVTVTAQSPLLEQSTASTGQLLDSEDIDNMPVNGRTPLVLSQLAFGAISTANPQFNHPFDNSGPSAFSLGGSSSKHNELLMDGAPDAGADGTIAFSPPMDAVEQVKVETFQSDAAYGHTSGGTVNQVTKQGTNTYHGSLYEFGQYSALNDTPWFTKSSKAKKSVTRFNQYGGSIGGPLSVPKLYNARDKMFFFFAFEGINDNSPSPAVTSVPTAAERSGDFSALLAAKGSSYTIYDPYSGVKSGSRVVRTAMSYNGETNVIPPGYLNTVGMNLLSYFDKANLTGNADGSSNYYYPGNSTDTFDSETARVDANLSPRNKIFFTFRHNYRDHRASNIFGNIATGSILLQPNDGAMIDDVHMFSSSLVWNNRVNWTRNVESRPLPQVDISGLGFPSSLASKMTSSAFPATSGTNYVDFGYAKGDLKPFDSFQYFTMLNYMRGRHSLEFGADLRLHKGGYNSFGYPTGLYTFSASSSEAWTNGPYDNSSSAGMGQQLASMMIGLPTTGQIDVNVAATTSAKYFALFVQDNWRVRPHLTLNLGVRYEHDQPTTESHNKSVSGFDTTTVSPINSAVQTAFAANPASSVTLGTIVGGLMFANATSPALYQTTADNFSPRIGFAWSPQAKSSVRGGFGLFNDSVGRVDPIQTGFNQTTQLVASNDSYLTPYATLSNPFPAGLTTAPGSSKGLATYIGQSVSAYAAKQLNAYSLRFDLDLQKELPHNILVEVGYVGNHGVHLQLSKSMNGVPSSYLNVGQSRDATVINFLTAAVPNPFIGLAPGTTMNTSTTVQRMQLLLPYPQFTGVTLTNLPAGSSIFHEFEARVEKRMSHGVRFLANYSWSKKLDRLSYLNAQDVKPEKRISADDRPQHLTVSATYELPFGKSRRFNPQIPVANYVISNWNLSGIWSYQPQGAPLSWGDIIYKGTNLNDLKVSPHNVKKAFDTTMFDMASADQPVTGDHLRTLPSQVTHARQDGINSFDFSLVKACQITARLKAQLRSDFFNAMNHPQFSAPSLTPTSSAFGTITSQANLPRTIQVSLRLAF